MRDIALIPDPETKPFLQGFKPNDPEAPQPEAIVQVLEGYRQEAIQARREGPNGRDDKWEENLDLYWNRYNFEDKADWQAKEVLPEVPSFVDRFAAAMKEAWTAATVSNSFTVVDPADTGNDIAPAIQKLTNAWLSRCGRNQLGQALPFETVIEDQTKLGALIACSSTTGWREDIKHGRVAIETVDPRSVWIDHTYRNLYRIRGVEMDKHQVLALGIQTDARGDPLFDRDEISRLGANLFEEAAARMEQLRGTGEQVTSVRDPVRLHEYYGTIVMPDGKVLAKDAYCVVANGRYLIRGPEPNPYWHGRDWLTYTPLIPVPLSVYGRTYAEDFGSIAKTYNQLTNLILDAVFTSSLKVFAVVPEMLTNPKQLESGLSPGKAFHLEMGAGGAKDFMHALELGTLSSDTILVWNTLKNELREAAGINEIALGQFAPKGRTSATEINQTQQSSSALVRSIAQTFEQRWVEPTLDLVWKTGLQHMQAGDKWLQGAVGPEMYHALIKRRKEFVTRPLTFQARGISTLIAKGQKLQALMGVLQVIAGNQLLLQQFMQVVDMEKLVNLLFDLSNIDIKRISMGEREQMMKQITEPMAAMAGQQGGSAPAPAAAVAGQLGVGR